MTQTLKFRAMFGAVVAVPVLALIFAAFLASAETAPVITTVIRNSNNVTTTLAPLGSTVHADVQVSSTTAPVATSTVDFLVYPNQTCSGTPVIQNNVALIGGFATSGTSTVSNDGISYKVHYDGQGDVHPAADGSCVSAAVTGLNTSIQTTLSTTSAPVESSVFDSAVLSGHTLHASGTVAYTFYTNSTCTANARSAGVKTVSGGSVPNSDTLVFSTPGTFYWKAVYSGDSLNSSATSPCTSEILNIFATSTPRGRITVDKVVVPDGNATSFHFNTGGSGYADFDLTGSSTPNTQELAVGTYSINEQNKSGWTTSATCSKNGATASTYSEGSSISLANGDHVTCVFTNTKSAVTPPNDDDDDGQCDKDDNHSNNGLHKGWLKDWKNFPFEKGSVKKFIKNLPTSGNVHVNSAFSFGDDDDDDDEKKMKKSGRSERTQRGNNN